MVAAESLLAPGRPHDGSIPNLLEHVDIRLALFLCLILVVGPNPRGVKIEVRRDGSFGTVYKEEGCETGQSVYAHPEAPHR